MNTTGSRQLFAIRQATALRLLIGVLALLAVAGCMAALANRADAGAVGTLTVNSTANTDDGDCEGPPNDNNVGNCTLREAINDVNAGLADTINFHTAVFSKQAPGVIQLDTGLGQLPPIEREVTIDNTGTAVVLDCDQDNDETNGWGTLFQCEYGIAVWASHNGFDFTLKGQKQFTIREINGDGIIMLGNEAPCIVPAGCSFGDVSITGVNIDVDDQDLYPADGDDGIEIRATNLNNILVDNSIVLGDDDNDGNNGIVMRAWGDDSQGDPDDALANNIVNITNNRIYGGDGVDVEFQADLFASTVVNPLNGTPHKATVNVDDNESIIGDAGDGVEINYCENSACDARSSELNISVTGNGKISSNDDVNGDGDAIRMDIQASRECEVLGVECNEAVTVDIAIADNAIVDGGDDDGVRVNVDVCCATSGSSAVIDVHDNLDIIGDDEGVELTAAIGAGPQNNLEMHVDNNEEITGQNGQGVKIEAYAGNPSGIGLGDVDSDENMTLVTVNGNEDINGDNDDGIKLVAEAGKGGGDGDADRNMTEVHIDGNNDITGEDDGVHATGRAGTRGGHGDGDDNSVIMTVNNNGAIDGSDDDGVELDINAGHTEAGGPPDSTGDGNSTDAEVSNNDLIKGHDGNGVEVQSWSGGIDFDGEDNSTNVDVTDNGEITGQQAGGDGVHIASVVCCDPLNTNTVNISGNDDIIGQDGDGIDIHELCCSVNTVSITDNQGVIKGNDDNGIEVTPCLNSGDPHDPTDLDIPDDLVCIGESVTFLIITGNDISDSGNDGIIVCCGAFQYPVTSGAVGKSLIADNRISHNGEDGIDMDTTIGINVEHNEIYQNGTSVLDGDNGVEVDWQFAYNIYLQSGETVKVPAHYNRISENSIYDNAGLGINLIGDFVVDQRGIAIPASGDENGLPADGVGCVPYGFTQITSNDCIAYPKLLFTGPGTKVAGSACSGCHVEIFLADDSPDDQTGPLGRQHGEGRTFLVATDADDLGSWTAELPCDLAAGKLTATATDKLKNTSEFSSNIPFPGTTCPTATPTRTNTPVPTNTQPPAPTMTPTSMPTKACGDVNDDGLVNAVDAQLILQLKANLVGSLPNEPSGDVNNDGQLTSVDAALILQYTAGLITADQLHCPA